MEERTNTIHKKYVLISMVEMWWTWYPNIGHEKSEGSEKMYGWGRKTSNLSVLELLFYILDNISTF